MVEVLVSLTLLAILMTSVAGVFYASMRTAGSTNHRTDAVGLAIKESEAMRAVPYQFVGFYSTQPGYVATFESRSTVTLGSGNPSSALLAPRENINVPPLDYRVNRYIVWADADTTGNTEAYKLASVIVTWTDEAGTNTARHDSIIYPGGRGKYSGPQNNTAPSGTPAPPGAPPFAPTLTSATTAVAPAGESTIDVTWTAPTGGSAVDHYVVQYATDDDFDDPQSSPNQPASATSFGVTALAPSTTYWFRVFAVAADNSASQYSNVMSATTLASTAPACSVTGLNVTGEEQESSSKTYKKNNGQMDEDLKLAVSVSGSCSLPLTVRGTRPSGTADPGSPYSLSGSGAARDGEVDSDGQAGWDNGSHTFEVLLNGTPLSPAVTKTFLVCEHKPPGQRSSLPSTC